MPEDDRANDIDEETRKQQFQHWMAATGLVVDSDMKYAMHDSLYSNPDQVDAYEEASELGVDNLAYAIWKLGWDDQVDGWVYDTELGWQEKETLKAARNAEQKASDRPNRNKQITLSDIGPDGGVDSDSDESWVYYVGPDGRSAWQSMETGAVKRQKVRPGPAPDGGGGYDDSLPGWRTPPKNMRRLEKGQLLEIRLADRDPELAVVMSVDAHVSIRTEYPDHLFASDEYISVLAVEDDEATHPVEVPEWAEAYRDA